MWDGDAELWWAVGSGVLGLVLWFAGSVMGELPPVDASDEAVVTSLVRHRSTLLVGSLLLTMVPALLIWPLAYVSTTGGWNGLRVASLVAWAFAFGFVLLSSVLVMGAVWRGPGMMPISTTRTLLDLAHLATWAGSAPAAAVAVVMTTVVGWQAQLFGWVVIALAAFKVVTVLIEVAGIGRLRGWNAGWNAGGRAAGISGVASVAWFGSILWAIGTLPPS